MLLEIDAGSVVAISLLTLLAWAFVLYYIIAGASRSQNIVRMQRMQVKILKEIALKNGVDEQKINDIIAEKKGV